MVERFFSLPERWGPTIVMLELKLGMITLLKGVDKSFFQEWKQDAF